MRSFGLIGKNLSHSFSKDYFEQKFSAEGISDAQYSLFPLNSIKEVIPLIEREKLLGFNVTIPYKEEIISLLDALDPVAAEIGAVNTVLIKEGKSKGFNTDIIGFKKSIRPFLAKEHNRALILGTGGASKAIAHALDSFQIPYYFCSQSKASGGNVISYADIDPEVVNRFPLIINCTPLGTFPNSDEMPPIPTETLNQNHLVYDLIYNPSKSKLLLKAEEQGALICNGANMLKIQAEESWKIWNS